MGVRDDAKSCHGWSAAFTDTFTLGSALPAHRVVGIGESEKSIAAPPARRRAVHHREHLRFESGKTADRRCGCTRKRSGMKHLLRGERGPDNIIVSQRRSVARVGKQVATKQRLICPFSRAGQAEVSSTTCARDYRYRCDGSVTVLETQMKFE